MHRHSRASALGDVANSLFLIAHVFVDLLRPRLSDGPIVSVALLGPASETSTHFSGQTT